MTPGEVATVLHGAYTLELTMPAWLYLLLGMAVAGIGVAGGRAGVRDERERRRLADEQARVGAFAAARVPVQAAQLEAATVALGGQATTVMDLPPRWSGLPDASAIAADWPASEMAEGLRAELADTLTYQRAIADHLPVVHRGPELADVYDDYDEPGPLGGGVLDADDIGDAAVDLGGEDGQDTPPDEGSGGGGAVVDLESAPAAPRYHWLTQPGEGPGGARGVDSHPLLARPMWRQRLARPAVWWRRLALSRRCDRVVATLGWAPGQAREAVGDSDRPAVGRHRPEYVRQARRTLRAGWRDTLRPPRRTVPPARHYVGCTP